MRKKTENQHCFRVFLHLYFDEHSLYQLLTVRRASHRKISPHRFSIVRIPFQQSSFNNILKWKSNVVLRVSPFASHPSHSRRSSIDKLIYQRWVREWIDRRRN